MNLIIHVIKKDIERLKWFFAGWMVWILAPVAFAAINLALSDGDIHLRTTLLNLVFYDTWMAVFLSYVLAALVIQQDSLVGTSAFWITRPISPVMLMAAKGILICTTLVLAPLGLDALTLSLENATLRDILLAMPDQLLMHLVMVIFAVIAAMLTPNFGAFAPVMAGLWYFASWVCFPLYIVKWLYYKFIPPFDCERFVDSQRIVVSLMAIVLGLGLIYLQYKTRQTRRTAILAVLAFFSLCLPQLFWKLDFVSNLQEPVSRQVLDTDKVDVAIAPHAVWLGTGDWAYPQPNADYSGQVSIGGAGKGQEIRLVDMKAQMTFSDGQVAKDAGWDFYPKLTCCDTPDAQAVQGALGDITLMNSGYGRSHVPPLMRLDQKIYKQFEKQTVTYQADMRFNVFQYKPEAEIALAPEAGYRSGSQSITIVQITPQNNGINVEIQEEAMHLPFNRDPHIHKVWLYEEDNVTYVLVNRRLKQALLPAPLDTYFFIDEFQTRQPLRIHGAVLRFSGKSPKWPKLPALTEDWLKDAVLMRIRLEPQGTFNKTIVQKDFPVAANGGKYSSPEKWSIYNIYRIPIRYNE